MGCGNWTVIAVAVLDVAVASVIVVVIIIVVAGVANLYGNVELLLQCGHFSGTSFKIGDHVSADCWQ